MSADNIPAYLHGTAYYYLCKNLAGTNCSNSDVNGSLTTSTSHKLTANVDNSDSEGEPALDSPGSASEHEDDEENDDDDGSLGDDDNDEMELDQFTSQESGTSVLNIFRMASDTIRIPRLITVFDSHQPLSRGEKGLFQNNSYSDHVPPLPRRMELREDLMAERDGWIDLVHPERAAIMYSDHQIPFECGIYYYEITVRCPSNRIIHAALGVASRPRPGSGSDGQGYVKLRNSEDNTDTFRAVADSSMQSWMYHSHGGRITSSRTKKHYGTSFPNEAVVGCGINFKTGSIFFTQQGKYLGLAFTDLVFDMPVGIGVIAASDTCIKVNLGQDPFMYDIEAYVGQERDTALNEIKSTYEYSSDNEIMEDIANHLVSAGYSKTFEALPSKYQEHPERSSAQQTASKRREIMSLISQGKIEAAIEELEATWPGLLEKHPNLQFRLDVQEVTQASIDPSRLAEAIKLAQTLHSKYGEPDAAKNHWQQTVMTKVFTLLGVRDPDSRPQLRDLYSQDTLNCLADDVNQVILHRIGFLTGNSLQQKLKECEELFRNSAAGGGSGALLPFEQFI